jgi:hypothetical protein
MLPLLLLALKNSVTGEHSGEPEVEVERAGPVLTVPSTVKLCGAENNT